MGNDRKREEMVAGLRKFADLLEGHESMPVPFYGIRGVLYLTHEEARAARKGIYGWVKHNSKENAYMSYTLGFGEGDYDTPVKLQIEVSKDEICTRVQTGTRVVEAVEASAAHEVPVYEWVCGEEAENL